MRYGVDVALPVAKLRAFHHYCPEAKDMPGVVRVAGIFADRIERDDTRIDPPAYKRLLEESLREWDPQGYADGSDDVLVPVVRLAALEFVVPAAFSPAFAKEVKELYSAP